MLFTKEIMSLKKNDIEDSWVPLLQLLYKPATSELKSTEKVNDAILFFKFLIALCFLSFN